MVLNMIKRSCDINVRISAIMENIQTSQMTYMTGSYLDYGQESIISLPPPPFLSLSLTPFLFPSYTNVQKYTYRLWYMQY